MTHACSLEFAMETSPHEQGAAALKQAQRASRHGNFVEAERWTKLAERMVAAAERLIDAKPPPAPDEEELRAEIRARIRAFVEVNLSIDEWEEEAARHAEATALALLEGLAPPPPLRPCPFGGNRELEATVRTAESRPVWRAPED